MATVSCFGIYSLLAPSVNDIPRMSAGDAHRSLNLVGFAIHRGSGGAEGNRPGNIFFEVNDKTKY